MSRVIKDMIVSELKNRYQTVDSACVVDMTGMNVQAQEKLRRTLRGKSAKLEVVKNSMARIAFHGGPLAALGESLEGPCALVTSKESLIEVAKILVESAREFKLLKLKRAVMDGDPTLLTIEELSRLRGKREILGELSLLISSPGRKVAACLVSTQAKIAGCLKAMIDKSNQTDSSEGA
jgi:large subunit ribosomal protein L10